MHVDPSLCEDNEMQRKNVVAKESCLVKPNRFEVSAVVGLSRVWIARVGRVFMHNLIRSF